MKLSDGFQTSALKKNSFLPLNVLSSGTEDTLGIFLYFVPQKQQQSDQKYSTEILTNIVTSIYQTIMDFYRNHLSF